MLVSQSNNNTKLTMAVSSISPTTKLHTALSRTSLTNKCTEITKIISEISLKDLHPLLPHLLESIFGFGNQLGWNIGKIHRNHQYDFKAVRSLLAPEGALLRSIYKLMQDANYRYEFPISCIPYSSRRSIEEGGVPNLYGNKLQFYPGQGRPHNMLTLNAFEYYFFHFSYFIVSPSGTKGSYWTQPAEYLYPTLFEDYCNYFLPADQTKLPPLPQNAQPVRSPIRSSANGGGSKLVQSFLKPPSLTSSQAGVNQPAQDTQETVIWCSQPFLQISVEFWLNQNTIEVDRFNFQQPLSESFLPTSDHVRIVRMLVKHCHYFANSVRPEVIHSPYSTPMPHPFDEFKRIAIPHIVQKRLYSFLKHSFIHWPLDSSFRLVLETWLSFIQPWRYMDAKLSPKELYDAENSNKNVEANWKSFIADNLLFYSALFHEMIPRMSRTDLSSSKNAFMVYRLAKIFNLPNLKSLIQDVESSLFEPVIPRRGHDIGASYLSPSNSGASLNMHFTDLEGPTFQYKPLFCEATQAQVQQLCHLLLQAKVSNTETSKSRESESGQGGFFQMIFSPSKDLNSQGYGYSSFYDDAGDQTRVAGHLDAAARHFSELFDFELPREASVSYQDPNMCSNMMPDMVDTGHGLELSPLGRYQMMNGLRRLNVNYRGDPDLQPIRSFENAALVRILHALSSYLNIQYAEQLTTLYQRNDFVGRVVYQFLHLPPSPSCGHLTNHSTRLNDRTHTMPDEGNIRTPRISFRFLADYRNIVYLFILYFVLSFFLNYSLGVMGFVLVIVFVVMMFACMKAALISSEKLKRD